MENETKALAVRQELTPKIWELMEHVGLTLYKTHKMNVASAAEGAIKAAFCHANGLDFTAARGLYIVNGKLGIESSVIAALLRKHPDYDYDIKDHDLDGCTIVILRHDEVIGEASFTMDDALRAGLATKDNWRKYPKDMLFAKAITRAQRYFAPDVFGVATYSTEEMGDWAIDAEVIEQKAVEPQRPKPPEYDQLIEQFGIDACAVGGVFTATNERELWAAIDGLSIRAADAESQELDAERAKEVVPTLTDVAEEVEAEQSPFKNEAK